MPRKLGPDAEKVNKIRKILKKNPNGLWVREIARKSELDKSTVSIYLSRYMTDEVENIFTSKNKWIKIVRLRKK
jgi:DNA invertase Pin-like site-specific DNA recombinase